MKRTRPNERYRTFQEFGSEKGFSLLEMMICLLLSAVLLGALFTVWTGIQKLAGELAVCIENRTDVNIAPLLLAQRIKAAGMNIYEDRAENLVIANDAIGIKADTGGLGGFPDGDTEDSFEEIWITVQRDELKIKSGKGTYQPFLKGIRKADWHLEETRSLDIELSGVPDFLDREGEGKLATSLFLWNTHPNLLPEVLP